MCSLWLPQTLKRKIAMTDSLIGNNDNKNSKDREYNKGSNDNKNSKDPKDPMMENNAMEGSGIADHGQDHVGGRPNTVQRGPAEVHAGQDGRQGKGHHAQDCKDQGDGQVGVS